MGAAAICVNLGTGVRLARRGSLGAAQHRWNNLCRRRLHRHAVDRPVRLLAGACAAGDDAGEPGRGVADTAAMNLVLLRLIGVYAGLSVLAFGGGNGVIPAARRRPSASLAFRRGLPGYIRHLPRAPGPGSLIGVKAAGMARAAVSFAAIFAPSRLACMWSPRYWERPPDSLGGWRWSAHRPRSTVGLTFARCPRLDA
jgi:chromate transporter